MDCMNPKSRIQRLFLVLLVLSTLPALAARADAIERVEPPNWWLGFRDTRLQLLVYGKDIARSEPTVDHLGVSIARVERVTNPNYLFVYLDLAAHTRPGPLDLVFTGPDGVLVHPYTLQAKNPDPAHARGFDASDAIYLVTPDRFANGDPVNDTLAGMGDAADRTNPGGRHGGDLAGIEKNLSYIKDMGFTALWLNPVLENRMPEYSYHGYSTTDFYRVDPRYGSNHDYQRLVAQARAMGIDVIMDMIINHIGSGHWWMDELPALAWLNHPGEPRFTSHIRSTVTDPHGADVDRGEFTDGWFVDSMPDLDQRDPLLADYLVQNALWWIETLGLNGIRMDTWPYPDKDFMARWTRRVMEEYPSINIVGEEWNENPAGVAYWQRGQHNHDGYASDLPSLMDFPLQAALREALAGDENDDLAAQQPQGLMALYRTLASDFVYPDPAALVVFADNHDMSRIFAQLGEDQALWRMAMAFVLTTRGVPQVYYGTEILMSSPVERNDGLIRSDFPGGWAGDPVNAFAGTGLSVAQQAARDFLQTLLQWRRDQQVIHHGELTHFVPRDGTYVYFRHDANDSVMVVLNKNATTVELALERFAERLAGYANARDVISGETLPLGATLSLDPRSVRLLELH
jgi:glycosidase